jgi:PAS domain-containing protein
MLTNEDYRLTGIDLESARRAVAVALVMSVSSDEIHRARDYLPPHSEMVRLLDLVGWAGAPETDVVLRPQDRRVLLDVVYAMLILAAEETARSVEQALLPMSPSVSADTAVLAAAESLAGLAGRLQSAVTPEAEQGRAADSAEKQVSPALRALADSVGLPVWIASPEFVIEWINPALEELLGADLDLVRGTPWHLWTDPADAPRVGQVLEAARLEHRNWSVEAGVGPVEGPFTRLLMIAAPRRTDAGALVGWTGICFDVTHNPALPTRLGAVTQALSVDAAKTNLMLRQLPAMIWTTDLELRCTFSHGAVFRSLGAESNQLAGRLIGEIVGTSDSGHPALVAHRRALGGDAAQYRDTFAKRIFDVIVEPLRDHDGHIVGCVGLGVEVTEKVERDREREQLLRQLRLAQRIGRMGSWELEIDSGAWSCSDEAYRVLGAEPGEIEPHYASFIDRAHPDDRTRLRDLHARGVQTGEGYETEYRIVLSDGVIRRIRGAVAFEHDDSGILVRVAGTLQDVSLPEGRPADVTHAGP